MLLSPRDHASAPDHQWVRNMTHPFQLSATLQQKLLHTSIVFQIYLRAPSVLIRLDYYTPIIKVLRVKASLTFCVTRRLFISAFLLDSCSVPVEIFHTSFRFSFSNISKTKCFCGSYWKRLRTMLIGKKCANSKMVR